jgi:hypothetical protein
MAGFGAPPDAVAWAALAVGLVLLARNLPAESEARDTRISERALVVALAVIAAALSAGYVVFYLRGGPRIVDATSYYLEARALSEGHVRIPIAPFPSGSFRGRFLLATDDGSALSVIFPPGYPALLALGFVAGAPMAVGPLLAAALVVASFGLAQRAFDDVRVARVAASLSALCGVLRYHTADTMSHGLSALLFATALWASCGPGKRAALIAGAASGILVATRPVSGLLCLALALLTSRRFDRAAVTLAGAVAPIAALVAEQKAATGAWLSSTQAAYYALADAPAGCFRYGFGSGIGCRFEHGDFVRAHLEHGYGVFAAFGTTLRRLKMHLADAGNVELFAPVLVYAVNRSFREAKARVLGLGVIGIACAYAPFYFDGNYPGGGARLYADVLPLEHVLVAWALVRLRAARFAAATALVGFAVHTSYDHRQLAEREGGRPMFERSVLERHGVDHGLVFVSTDHGFNLGFDPRALAHGGVVVARRRHDAHDAELWQALGRPDVYDYVYDPARPVAAAELMRITLDPFIDVARFEAESEWPPLRVTGGSVVPIYPACASRGRALLLTPDRTGTMASIRLEAPASSGKKRRVTLGWVRVSDGLRTASVTLGRQRFEAEISGPEDCGIAEGPELSADGREFLEVSTEGPLGIDFIELRAP